MNDPGLSLFVPRFKSFLNLFLIALSFSCALAHANVDSAKKFIHGLIELSESQRQQKGSSSSEVKTKIKTLSDQVNFTSLAEKALTPRWNKLKASQRVDFMKTLQSLLEEVAYPQAKKIKANAADLHYAAMGSPQKVRVSGKIERSKKGEIINSDFEIVLHYAGGKITDVVLEEELLSKNLKRQFAKAFETQSFDEILTKMKNRLPSAKKTAP